MRKLKNWCCVKNISSTLTALVQTNFLDSSRTVGNFGVSFATLQKKSRSLLCVLFFNHKFYFSWRVYLIGYFVMFSMEMLEMSGIQYIFFSKSSRDSSHSTQIPCLFSWGMKLRTFSTKKQNFSRYNQPPDMLETCMQPHSRLWTPLHKSKLYWHIQLLFFIQLMFEHSPY